MNHAVQTLIQRMQTHPEDFFGPIDFTLQRKAIRAYTDDPKFRHIAVQIERHIIGAKDRDESSADSLWHLTAAEREALRIAYTEARRVRFDAEVFHTLMVQPEPEPNYGAYSTAIAHNLATSLTQTKQVVSENTIGRAFNGGAI